MLRRNVRLRKEYLYRKNLEGDERKLYEKKRKISEALQGSTDSLTPSCFLVTRHEIQIKKEMRNMSEQYPHLNFEHFTTQMGKRVMNILKHIFPVPKLDSKRMVTFSNESDYISLRNHVYDKGGGPKSIELKEIGPRFELRLYQGIQKYWTGTASKAEHSLIVCLETLQSP
ncbi:unnamed protein product [Eruca vesicaria subsp. sativa]|uniref:Brix domain-containing protein n=1 Tax=Eruca vesicaria subsp. sativa TaxID=29727 RepID=A0ABC8L2H3_ERUVS|nr:unnamed protein product [Eruca vesicaria subsp. sativa]